MIVDESALDLITAPFDVVIVGSGPAGVALAVRLGSTGLRVMVVEAGGERQGKADKRDLRGTVESGNPQPRLDLFRTRALGGTSRIWGGRCIPLDAIDFEERDWVANSGWPIARSEVSDRNEEAMAFLEAGSEDTDPASVFPDCQPCLVEGLDGHAFKTTLERFSKPTDVWRAYGEGLRRSHSVWILERTQAIRVALRRSDPALAEGVDVVGPSRRIRRIQARACVVAAGGLETPRLLLASDDVDTTGIGNGHSQVGRHYMSHLCVTWGVLTVSSARTTQCGYGRDAEGVYVRRRLWLTEAAQRERRLLNATFRTHLPDPSDPRHGDAVLSAMFLAKSLVQPEYAARFSDGPVGIRGHLRHLGNIALAPGQLAAFSKDWMRERIRAERKLPSVVRVPTDGRHMVEIHCEQSPDPGSRVSLGWDRDSRGMRRLHVHWRVAEDDVRAVRGAYSLLRDEVQRTGVGHLDVDLDALEDRVRSRAIAGGHHIGTVRMSSDPANGVVDGDCLVHGKRNLWLAGSGVMPTSGQANPTLTIVCLAMRLADEVALRLGHSGSLGAVKHGEATSSSGHVAPSMPVMEGVR